jgi:hypothetical protein
MVLGLARDLALPVGGFRGQLFTIGAPCRILAEGRTWSRGFTCWPFLESVVIAYGQIEWRVYGNSIPARPSDGGSSIVYYCTDVGLLFDTYVMICFDRPLARDSQHLHTTRRDP